MNNNELINTIGGAVSYTSASFLNAVARGINAFYNLGKSIGTAIKTVISGKICS